MTGEWRVNVGAKVVSARFVRFVDTVPHVVYTIPMTRVLDTDAVFEAKGQTGAGDLIIKLTRGGAFTYTIKPYNTTPFWTPGYSCPDGVTFPGVLT